MFSKEVLVKMKHKTFKGRREVILESWGLTEGDSQNRDGATDTFGVLVWALKNSFESWK